MPHWQRRLIGTIEIDQAVKALPNKHRRGKPSPHQQSNRNKNDWPALRLAKKTIRDDILKRSYFGKSHRMSGDERLKRGEEEQIHTMLLTLLHYLTYIWGPPIFLKWGGSARQI